VYTLLNLAAKSSTEEQIRDYKSDNIKVFGHKRSLCYLCYEAKDAVHTGVESKQTLHASFFIAAQSKLDQLSIILKLPCHLFANNALRT